jgi:hypothetical protein
MNVSAVTTKNVEAKGASVIAMMNQNEVDHQNVVESAADFSLAVVQNISYIRPQW